VCSVHCICCNCTILFAVFRSRHKAADQRPKKPTQDNDVELKPVKTTKDGKEGQPLVDGKEQSFTVDLAGKYEGDEKEPLKSEISASAEKAHAAESGDQVETAATVQCKTYDPSLWLAIIRTYFKPFLVGAFFKLGHDSLMFVSPMLLKYVFICDFYFLHIVVIVIENQFYCAH